MTNFVEQEEVIGETPFDRLGVYLDDLRTTRETDHSHILDEHAEYLRALTRLDELLLALAIMQKYGININMEVQSIIQQMRAAIPPSIMATRKENVSRET